MSMRPLSTVTLGLVLVAALSGSVLAQAPQPRTEGIVTAGAIVGSNDGNQNRLNEYEVAKDGTLPNFGAQVWGNNGSFKFDLLASHGGDNRDQKYGAYLSGGGGRFKASVTFDRFLHRLDHDPLDYMEAGVGNFVVRSTDHDPGTEYSTANGLLSTDVSFAATKNVEFFVSHKMVMRDGVHQGLTMSHCANCHVESYGRKLDQTTNTLAAGARINAGRFSADYTYENRTFEENAPTPTNTYDNAVHPVTLADVFLNRVQYDDGNGPLTFDLFPKFTKQTSTVRAAYALPGDGAVSGNFTHSSSFNDYSGFGSDFTGGHARVTIPLGKRAYLRGLFRKYEIETESVFVDVVEPVSPAGPGAGLTYAQLYPAMLPLDYNTESAASRSPTEMALELAFRPGKRSSINLGYEYEEISRETFHVEKTTSSLFKAAAYWRPDKTLSLRGRYEQAIISDPFANINAAKPAALQLVPTPGGMPFGPLSLQYFEMYDSRMANLAAHPTDTLFLEGTATWSPSQQFTVSGHYRYRDQTNDELNYSTWGHAMHMPGVEIYVAPTPRFTMAAGWGYQKDTLDTVFSTLNFGG
ncbi:MAG: GSU2204 family CXXCH-containing (seleno)protein [Vicinamibacterales bacterium]